MLDEDYGVTIDDYDEEFLLMANHRANMNKAKSEGLRPVQERNAVYVQATETIDTFSSKDDEYNSFTDYMSSVEGRNDAILGLRAGASRNSQKHYREKIPVKISLPTRSFSRIFNKLENVFGVEKTTFTYYGAGDCPLDAYGDADLQMSVVANDGKENVHIVTAATENGLEARGITADSGEILKKSYDVIDELEIAYDAFIAESKDQREGQWIVADEGTIQLDDMV